MYVEMLDQPISSGYCFQNENTQNKDYLRGKLSTNENETLPAIRICDYKGQAHVRVSCVTKSPAYRPHPCMLTGPDCSNGVFTKLIECVNTDTIVYLSDISIMEHSQFSTVIENALKKRKEWKIDPFQTGFNHINYVRSLIDLKAVRLCFEVFTQDENDVILKLRTPPFVSDIVYNDRNNYNQQLVRYSFTILMLSHTKCPVDAECEDITLFCEEVIPRETEVCFLETAENGQITWESCATHHIYRETTLQFRPPKYRDLEIREPVNVLVQLRLVSKWRCSEAVTFQYQPLPFDDIPPLIFTADEPSSASDTPCSCTVL